MRIAIITVDNRDEFQTHAEPWPRFGPPITALLAGLSRMHACEVHVVCCVHQAVSVPDRIGPNLHYHACRVPQWGWLRGGYLGCVRAVRNQLNKIEPDVVHGQGTERYCALAAAWSGRPNVVTLHGVMREVARVIQARPLGYHWLAARLESFALRRTGGVVCNSAYTEAKVRQWNRRTWSVPNALLEDFFTPAQAEPPKDQPPRLVNVGVVRELKQQVELLAAMGRLHARGMKFRLEFAGRLDATSAYGTRFTSALRLAESQGWAAWVGELPADPLVRWLDGAAALVHVSREESFGLAVAEGLARNLKFFGFGAGAVPEVAAGAEGAELFVPDDWHGLTEAIGGWLSSGAPRPTTAAGRMRERFHPDLVARRHVEIYGELLAGRGTARA